MVQMINSWIFLFWCVTTRFFFNRDELLSGMTKLDEQLDMYLGSLKQLKMLDLSTEELKDQQETLQAAISNPQHPLHTVQAK